MDITTLATTRTVGGSLVVTIPAEVVRVEDLREGETIEIKVKKVQKDYFGALKGIGSYNRKEDRMVDRE
jgi:hypothetical protein